MAKKEETLRRKAAKKIADKAADAAKRGFNATKDATGKVVRIGAETLRRPKVVAAREKLQQRAKRATNTARARATRGGTALEQTTGQTTRSGPEVRSRRARNLPARTGGGSGGGGGRAIAVRGDADFKPDKAAKTPKKKFLGKTRRLLMGPVGTTAGLAYGAYELGEHGLAADEERAENLRTDDQLGALGPSGGDVLRDDGIATPFRSFAQGMNDYFDQTDLSEAAKYNAAQSLSFTPEWLAPTSGNFPEANPTGRSATANRQRATDDEALAEAARATGGSPGDMANTVSGLQQLRSNLNNVDIAGQSFDTQRGKFAEATGNTGPATPEQITEASLRLGVNPDLVQQAGVRQTERAAPLVQYDESGRPIESLADEHIFADSTGAGGSITVPEGETAGIRRRVGPDGTLLYTDLDQVGSAPGVQTEDAAGGQRFLAGVPQLGQEAIDSTLDHLRRGQTATNELARQHRQGTPIHDNRFRIAGTKPLRPLGSNTGPGMGLRILGGADRAQERFGKYRDKELDVLRSNVRETAGAISENREANLQGGPKPDVDPASTLRSFEEIASIEDPNRRRAAIMDRQQKAGELAAAELAFMTSPEAIDRAIDPTGQLRRSGNKRDLSELDERRDAYTEQQQDTISARYGLDNQPEPDALDTTGMDPKDMLALLKEQRAGVEFADKRLDRAADRTDDMITRLDPDGAGHLQQDAIDVGLYDDPNLTDRQRRDSLTTLSIMRNLADIYPKMEPEFTQLLNNTPPADIPSVFRGMFEDGTLSRENPGFWSGVGNLLSIVDSQQGMDEIGAFLSQIWDKEGTRLIGKPGTGDFASQEEFLEEAPNLTEEDLRRVIPR